MMFSEQSPEPLPTRTDPREQWLMNDLEKRSAIGEIGDRAIGILRLKARYYLAAGALVIGGGLIVQEITSEDAPQQPGNTAVVNDTTSQESNPCVDMMQVEIEAGLPVGEAWAEYESCQQNDANGGQLINLGE